MSMQRRFLASAAVLVFSATFSQAQNIAPAHSGTVHYFEGDVSVDGAKLASQTARFTEIKEQGVLQTGLGRAEILLTPGVLLRVGENSSVKMLDNRLLSTRVEFLSGIAMLESVDGDSSVKDPAVTVVYKDFSAEPVKFGVFEMTSEPAQLRVFKGEAKVFGNGTNVTVKDGNLIGLTTTMASSKFDAKEGDDLYLWSRDRSAYLSAGNMSSARTLAASGYGSGYGVNGLGVNGFASTGWDPTMWRGFSGGWYYNSYLGMYSYLPFAGTIFSPFGYGYYNPITIGDIYVPGGYYWQGAGGARTGTTTGVPLSSAPSSGTTRSSNPQLPRLGNTAVLRPSLTSSTRGLGAGSSATMAARNNALTSGVFGANTPASAAANSGLSAASTGSSVRSAAPVASAPAASASASASRGASARR
jgi:hypothetical protein